MPISGYELKLLNDVPIILISSIPGYPG